MTGAGALGATIRRNTAGRHRLAYPGPVRPSTIAFLVAAGLVAIAIVSAVAHPLHWERTSAAAVTAAALALFIGLLQLRRSSGAP